ncbi:uncharacterized protein LOC121375316 [Gigantopelta aegis]|uniref:uncharacterized protein LOC121375316 n=1 Tax=Gigantopelta aegis TaxID=1735272 RepID=UPI001B887B27|nr:uncharacterized protein LOC121375316 [Gigantopelta aegis]
MLNYFQTFDIYFDADTSGEEEIIYDDDNLKRDEDFDLTDCISYDLAIERIAFDSENIWENNNEDSALKYMYHVLLKRHNILQQRIETTTASDILAAIIVKNNDVPCQDYNDDISDFEALTLKSEIPYAPTYDYLTDENLQLHSAYWDDVKIVGFGRNKTSPFPAYNDSFDPRLTFRGLYEDAFHAMCGFVPSIDPLDNYNVILPVGRIPEVVCDYFDKYNSLLNDLRTSPWDLYDENLETGNEVNQNNALVKTNIDRPWSETTSIPYLAPNVTSFLCDKTDLALLDTEGELLKKKTLSDSVKDLWRRTLNVGSPVATTDRGDDSVPRCYTSPCRPEHEVAYSTGDPRSNVDAVQVKTQTECHAVWPSQLYPFGPIPNVPNHISQAHTHEGQDWVRNTESRVDSAWTPRETSYANDWACLSYNKEPAEGHCLFPYDNDPRHVAVQPVDPDLSKRSPEWNDPTLMNPELQENNNQYTYVRNEAKQYMNPWPGRSKQVSKSPPSDLNSQSFIELDDGDNGQAIPVIISKSQHDHHKKRHPSKHAKTTGNRPKKDESTDVKPRSSQLSPTCEPFVPHRSKKYMTDDNANSTNCSFDYEQQHNKDQPKTGEHHMMDCYEQADMCQTKYMNTYNGYVKTDDIDIVNNIAPSHAFPLDRAGDCCEPVDYPMSAPPAHKPNQFELSNERLTEPSFSSHMFQETQYSEEIQYSCFVSQREVSKQNHMEERHELEQRPYMPVHAQQKNPLRFMCGDESPMQHSDIPMHQQPPSTAGEAQFYKWQNVDIQPGVSQSQSMEKQQQPVTWHDPPGMRQNEYPGSNPNAGNMSMPPGHVTCVTQPSFNSNVRKVIFLTKQPTTHLQPQQPLLQTPKQRQTIPLQHHAIQTSQAMYHNQQNRMIDASGMSRPDPYQNSRVMSGTIHHIPPNQQTRVNPAAYPNSYRTYASVATKLVVNNHGPRPYDQLGSARTIAMTAPKYTSNMVAIPTIEGYQPGRFYGPMFNFNNHNATDACEVDESSTAVTVDHVGTHAKDYDVYQSSRKEARPIRANPANLIRIK